MTDSSPKSKRLAPPRGMREFYPEDMAVQRRIFNAWRTAAATFGFVEYDACIVESLDLLKRKAGEEIVDQIYAFKDKSGRELALRPEVTPSLARMVAARSGSLAFPLKWSTIAQCFRYERTTRGRKREHYQWNLDIVGEESASAEAEVVAAAAHALSLLGVQKKAYTIRFSSRSLLSELLECTGVPARSRSAVFLALDKKEKIGNEGVAEILSGAGLSSSAVEDILALVTLKSLPQAAAALGEQTPAYRQAEAFAELLSAHGLEDCVRFDLSIIRGLAYYTGIVFEAHDANRSLRAIFGGGRYDNLLADIGGRPATGAGLGFGDVVLHELLSDLQLLGTSRTHPDVAIGYLSARQQKISVRIASCLRGDGRNVDLALREEKAKTFFGRASRLGAAEAIYIGPDDLEKGTVRIKNLATREERRVALAELGIN